MVVIQTRRVAIAFVLLAVFAVPSASSAAHIRVGIGAERGKIRGIKVSCFDRAGHRYVERMRPGACIVAGIKSHFVDGKGEVGNHFSVFPLEHIRWARWGRSPAEGTLGTNPGGKVHFRLFLSRRIKCGDGSFFYSRAVVFNTRTAEVSYLRLAICGEQSPSNRASGPLADFPLPPV
jgi:hypothetical protein